MSMYLYVYVFVYVCLSLCIRLFLLVDTFRGVYIAKVDSSSYIERPRLYKKRWVLLPCLDQILWVRVPLVTLFRDLVKIPNSQETKWKSNEKVSGAQEKGVGGTCEGCPLRTHIRHGQMSVTDRCPQRTIVRNGHMSATDT